MEVIWTKPATEDLKAIFKFHKQNVSVQKATQVKNRVLDKTELLTSYNLTTKEIGQIELDLISLNQEHRYLIEGHYKIIYFTTKKFIYITHVFDTRQHPNKKNR